ncbi:ATP-binding cassette subfamily B protein [Paenibacillus pabuli]|uniref:ATP-binding cassette subfamily B protein n=1 Tax=Paenibacillus pabuli TaxID=1472 RepID=A0ABX9BER0_9BACL|nr:ABC transporter ATP-binding protein [Paenibacillus pabuli]RAI89555.1 ATP-binding cassette subfamily B protein [Paenibacillus pabuli]
MNDTKKRYVWKSYVWTLSYLKSYKKEIVFLICFILVTTSVENVIPKLVQILIDKVIPNQNLNLFVVLLLILFVSYIVMYIAKASSNILERSISEKTSRDLEYSIFLKLRQLGFSYYEENPSGQTLSLFNTEVATVLDLYRTHLPSMINHLLFVVISVVYMLSINLYLTMIMIPCLLIYYILGPYLERKTANAFMKVSQKRMVFGQKIYESLSGIRDFRAFGVELWNNSKSVRAFEDYSKDLKVGMIWANIRGSYRRLVSYLGAVAIFYVGHQFIQHQIITTGGFVAFILLYFTAMMRLTFLVTSITEQKNIIYQIEALYHFYNKSIDVVEPSSPLKIEQVKGELRFHNVHFGYNQDETIIKGFDLYVKPGEKVAFVGTSGNGKSTLFKLIGRFYDVTEGNITLDGVPINKLSFKQLRSSIGYVFQDTYLFGGTIKENIRFGFPDATDEQIIEAAKAAYAHEFIDKLPKKYETIVGERGINLSGGQRQRISIARLFLKKPSILLLDEATSALDNTSENMIKMALEKITMNKTTIVIAHRLSTIINFDKIVVIHDGKVAEVGTYDGLFKRKGHLYALVKGQRNQPREEVLNGIS